MQKATGDKYLIQFGKNLRKIRKAKNMSMEALAYSSDMEYSQISRIEHGKINTSIKAIKAIADTLGVKPKDLFDF